jgi:hypothetical protein
MSNKLSIWIGIISSVVTIALTILNFNLNKEIQQTELKLKVLETELKQKSHELDVSREKTERYEFVYKVLPDILNKDKEQVILTTNLITLALTDEEANKLFVGLSNSEDENVQVIGKAAIENITREKSNYVSAIELSKEAFDAMISGDIDKAIRLLDEVEKVYPTFGSIYEINRLLKRNRNRWSDMEVRKSVYNQIIKNYSWKVPPEYVSKLREFASQ